MSFRARIDANPETLAEFEQAWEQRYQEGLRLLEDEATRTGGVYLLGYVAEMILKVAYFRFIGAASDDLLEALLTTISFKTAVKNMGVEPEFYHNPRFWTELLISTRKQNNRNLPAHLQYNLQMFAENLYDNWKVDIRYHSLMVEAQEWRDVKEATEWFYNHHASLWR